MKSRTIRVTTDLGFNAARRLAKFDADSSDISVVSVSKANANPLCGVRHYHFRVRGV